MKDMKSAVFTVVSSQLNGSFLLMQPPFSTELDGAYIIHYTYGCDYNMKVSDQLRMPRTVPIRTLVR